MEKTNASRILEKQGISFELKEYKVDPEHLEATHVAEELGQDIATVFKTLVLHGDKNGHFVCVIQGDREVDLKKAAKASGNKKVAMIPMKELLPLTGYIRGGCTAIGMKKAFPVYLDQNATNQEFIHVSAGKRGLQIKLNPQDYIKATKATLCDLITSEEEEEQS
ncbi:MAG: Cys-tRNA(Pro) deacylase [Muribaculaceae bacterium]|nr:Cys-tRNA(Pro) deacylase [Muribaculaceae bacterium]